ncbi:MAG: hypothetical protein RRC07_16145, partial [Anaerolineae bacterium]|nr:hypothetical protein [Anaerolineae bacterium]
GQLRPEALLRAGQKAYTSFEVLNSVKTARRWGDYTGLTADPDGVRFWYVGQYSTSATTSTNWGTYVSSFADYPGETGSLIADFDTAAPGSIIALAGADFVRGERVRFDVNGVPRGFLVAACDGGFQVNVITDGADPGTYLIEAIGSHSSGNIEITVDTAAPVRDSVIAEFRILLSGLRYLPLVHKD